MDTTWEIEKKIGAEKKDTGLGVHWKVWSPFKQGGQGRLHAEDV